MSLQADAVKGSEDFQPIPAGIVTATLVSVVDLGLQAVKAWKSEEIKEKEQILVSFELGGNDDEALDGKTISKKINQYGDMSQEKSLEVQYLTALNANREERSYNWGELLGTNVMLNIINKTRDNGKVMHQIAQIMPVRKSDPRLPDVTTVPFVFSFAMAPADALKAFTKVPNWVKEIIQASLSYQGSDLSKALAEIEASSEGTADAY